MDREVDTLPACYGSLFGENGSVSDRSGLEFVLLIRA